MSYIRLDQIGKQVYYFYMEICFEFTARWSRVNRSSDIDYEFI